MTNRDPYAAGSMRINEQGFEGVPQAPLPRPAGVAGAAPRPTQVYPGAGVGPGPRAMPQQGVSGVGLHAHHPQAPGRGAAGTARAPAAPHGSRVRPVHETCDLREQFLTPEDLRDSFTQYIVFRFEKIADEERYDADGKPREEESTWLYARRTRVCDREQKDIFHEICDLTRSSPESFAARRKALSKEQIRQVENTLAELQQDEPDPARFETTLVQLDEKFETLTDRERREYDRKRGRRSETYRTTSSGVQVKRKKKKRVAITAYYKRAPKPGVDIGQLIKERQAEMMAQALGVAQQPPVHQQRERPQPDNHGFPAATVPPVPPPQPREYNGQGDGYVNPQVNTAPRAPPIPPPYNGTPGYPGHQEPPRHGQPPPPPPRPVAGAQSAHPMHPQQQGAPGGGGGGGGGVNTAAANAGGAHIHPPPRAPPPPGQRDHQGSTAAANAAPHTAHGGGGGGGDNRRRSASRHGPQAHDRQRRPQRYRRHVEQDVSSSPDSSSECSSVCSESTDEDQSTMCTSDDLASIITSDLPSPKYRHQRHASHQERRRRPSLHRVHVEERPYRARHSRRYSTGGQTTGAPSVGYGYMHPQPPPQPPLIFNPPSLAPQQPAHPAFVPAGTVPVAVMPTPTPSPTAVMHPQPMDPVASFDLANGQMHDALNIVYVEGLVEGRRQQQAASETIHVATSATAARQRPRTYHPRHPPSAASTSADLGGGGGGARYADAAEVESERRRVDRLEQMVKNMNIDARDRGRDRDPRWDRDDSDERRYREGSRYHWGGGRRRDSYGCHEQDREDARWYRRREVDDRERERERFDRRPSPHEHPWSSGPDRRDGFVYSVGRDSWADSGAGSGHGAGYSLGARRRANRGYYPGRRVDIDDAMD